jgi:hypothetical protein
MPRISLAAASWERFERSQEFAFCVGRLRAPLRGTERGEIGVRTNYLTLRGVELDVSDGAAETN